MSTLPLSRNSNSHEIINSILTFLFQGETRRHQQCIDHIVSRNSVRSTFMHGGLTYRPSWIAAGSQRVSLDENLWPDMDRFLLDKNAVDWDCKAFWQVLFSMVNPCLSLQEVRDTLPDFIVELVPSLKALSRTDTEAFTIDDDPRVLRQYHKYRPKMELYAQLQTNPSLAKLMSLYNFEV